MITLHTLENTYDDGQDYHQFVQRAGQSLLDSGALGSVNTLRSFLTHDVIGSVDELHPRTEAKLLRLLEAGDINKLLIEAEKANMRAYPAGCCVNDTRFGEWEFDSLVIDPPSLREQQEDVWASAEDFPRSDWQHEVANGDTHIGYWEWVEHMREAAKDADKPLKLCVIFGNSLGVAFEDIHDQTHKEHFDGDDAELLCRYSPGDCDSVNWPNPNIATLRGALYAARETGLIRDVKSVLLPDGSEFFIDEPYWKVGDHVTWTDPDDSVCSRTGILKVVDRIGDSDYRITMEDGWEAEVCESELKRVDA